MPSNVELAKRLESLETKFENKLEDLVNDLTGRLLEKIKNRSIDEHGSLCDTVEFLSKEYDAIRARQDELIAANKALANENEALRKKLADLDQYSRMNNVEIKGVPSTQGEECAAILEQVGQAIGCPVSTDDIDCVHRVAAKSGEKNIIARFVCREKKNEFVKKARKARIHTSQIGFGNATDRAVYVNDHLTLENKKLFSRALALKKEKRWSFLWTENCQIKARKTNDSRVFRILADSDLRIFT